jgi:hypothetical protein
VSRAVVSLLVGFVFAVGTGCTSRPGDDDDRDTDTPAPGEGEGEGEGDPVGGEGEGEGEGEGDPVGGEGEGEGEGDPVGGEGEGEGEGDPVGGEGEGEGEGDPRPTPTASVVLDPQFAVPADGVTELLVTVVLTGRDVGGRVVDLGTTGPGPDVVPASVSDGTGRATFALTSTIPGRFTLELSVDGVLVDIGAPAVVFASCTSLEETFLRETWPAVLSRCVGCHNEFGYAPALGARFVLPFPGDRNFAARGVQAVRAMLERSADEGLDLPVNVLDDETRQALLTGPAESTLPLLLTNPVLGHTGGVVIGPDEREVIAHLRSFLGRVGDNSDTCRAGSEHGIPDEDLLASTSTLAPKATFRHAVRVLTAGNPSAATLNTIVDEASLGLAIDRLLETNRAVERRLGEIWNDWLLTDANVGTTPRYLASSFPGHSFFNPLRSEGARGGNSCDDRVAGNCCRIPEDPLNLDENPDNDVPPKPENVACAEKQLQLRAMAGREPIELLMRIWRDDVPASRMLTNDETIVDPSLARAYGLLQSDGRTFRDGSTAAFNTNPADDATERRQVRLVDTDANRITDVNASLGAWPHQGIFSTPSFLRRFPTTASNRERTRARVVLESFLAVPIMKFAAFAAPEIPPGQSLENLTWDTQPCVVCHVALDPIASNLNMWNGNTALLTTRVPCRHDGMRGPGFGFVALPGEGAALPATPRPALDNDNDCPVPDDGAGTGALDTRGPARFAWLVDRVVEHPRFAYAVVVPLYEGLLGTKLVGAPESLDDPDFDAKARAFAAQQRELATIVDAFVAGGGRFRPAVKAILMSRSFRAVDVAAGATPDAGTARALELLGIGVNGRLATPENVARRLENLTGLPWTRQRNPNAAENLAPDGFYNVLFGGIDSDSVTVRSRDPSAVRAAVARRLGNEVACIVVPQDLSIVDSTTRPLFRSFDLDDEPLDAAGNIVPAVDARIRAQVRRLHVVLWNEEVVDDAEIEASVALFYAALRELRAPASGVATPTGLGACQAVASFERGTRTPYPNTGTAVIDGVERRRVASDPTHTLRAWMAVLASILADSRFLFE